MTTIRPARAGRAKKQQASSANPRARRVGIPFVFAHRALRWITGPLDGARSQMRKPPAGGRGLSDVGVLRWEKIAGCCRGYLALRKWRFQAAAAATPTGARRTAPGSGTGLGPPPPPVPGAPRFAPV